MAIQEDNPFNPAKSSTAIWELVAEGDWLVGQRFRINGHAVLGRDASCDITIPGTHLSRRHAELAVKGNKLQIRDLGSSNGTYVNDVKVMDSELKTGDTVRFDVLRFRIQGPESAELDSNATMIREALPKKPVTSPKPRPDSKNWKTKPTSVGNRSTTEQMSTVKKASNTLWTAIIVVIGLATVAGIGFLITQL
ncbi:FHA domain-containing protein [Oceanicoccus sp. KOV_DT_Chl]|uniref:FHA domain-containing protein n=1 Tax=Oceanicoccus sp. KOV_DT_Chl TaxID=1904639 RepID=UPI00135AE3F4|nr:FHA domain-containing protein [Oceanicoccus sp. KOV_DT_Chl]